MQQVIGHIWAKELWGSSLQLGRTSLGPAEKHKPETARQRTILTCKTRQAAAGESISD